MRFGRGLDVHAVDAGRGGGICLDGGPGRDFGLLRLTGHQAGLEGEGQHLPQGLDLLLDPADEVRDERLQGAIDARLLRTPADLHEPDSRLA